MSGYGKPYEIEVEGLAMRAVAFMGTPEEIDRVVEVDGPAKGWELHQRAADRVVLRKNYQAGARVVPPVEEDPKAAEVRRAADRATRDAEEWQEALSSTENMQDGNVACCRCSMMDRSLLMHGMVRCGSPASRSSITGRATFYGPGTPRKCRDYVAAVQK